MPLTGRSIVPLMGCSEAPMTVRWLEASICAGRAFHPTNLRVDARTTV